MDTSCPIDELPIEAQYNVTADELATDYIDKHPQPRNISPLLPATSCTLHLGLRTVNGGYTQAIREAASLPELFGYLKAKYKWTNTTQLDIGWTWFQRAASNYKDHSNNHLMKLVYDKFPTNSTKHTSGGQSWIPRTCRYCNLADETFHHLLKCNHEHANRFRKALPKAIRKYCLKHKIPDNFHTAVIIASEDWLRDIPPLEQTPINASLKDVIYRQKQIGWDQFFRGYFTTYWQRFLAYEFDHDTQNPTSIEFRLYTILWWYDQNNMAPTVYILDRISK